MASICVTACINSGRRRLLGAMAASAAALAMRPSGALQAGPLLKSIPSTGEQIPCVGLGTWITFNVGNDTVLRDECVEVMRAFFAVGGRLIDSSPMYGSAQEVVGYGLAKLERPPVLFSADKVWTSGADEGRRQVELSRRLWGIPRFDLLQVHNLLSWEDHLATLHAMKEAGNLRYIGITTSEGRRHKEFERIMATQALDFIQVTYNIVDREVEQRILPLARERGIAVIVNRPFQQGTLIRRLEGKPLPEWAHEAGARSWSQFILKFIVCRIPPCGPGWRLTSRRFDVRLARLSAV